MAAGAERDGRRAGRADSAVQLLASNILYTMTRPGRLAALLLGCLASGVALVLQSVVRDVWQIRTLPERVMEWLLLFVPLDLFERGLQQLGADAKEVALAGTVVGMAAILVGLGALALRSGLKTWVLLGLGIGLWLGAM